MNDILIEYRNKTLQNSKNSRAIFECGIAEAKAWGNFNKDNIMLWKGEKTFARLSSIPIFVNKISPIVGVPAFNNVSLLDEHKKAFEVICKIEKPLCGDMGHVAPNITKIFNIGIGGFYDLIEKYSVINSDKKDFYASCKRALDGLYVYIENTENECRKQGLTVQADICKNIKSNPPQTFQEALQLMYFVFVAYWYGEGHAPTSPGRMDQTLISFYNKDIKNGILTKESALELLCYFYIEINNAVDEHQGVAALLAGRDEFGNKVLNALTYLCLEAKEITSLVYPSVGVAWYEGMPEEFMDYCVKILATGVGDPSFFNDDLITSSLIEMGVEPKDAYNWLHSTCVETGLVGCSNIWSVSPFFNTATCLSDGLSDIYKGNKKVDNIDDIINIVKENISLMVDKAVNDLEYNWKDISTRGFQPLLSCFTDDCLARGLDYVAGGAKYNWAENAFVGIPNIVDSIYALDNIVYKEKLCSFKEFYEMLEKDFVGYEDIYSKICNLTFYGNDNDEVDSIAIDLFNYVTEKSLSKKVAGHQYIPGAFCYVLHEAFGKEIGATPDGRFAYKPLSDGAGAVQGRDINGPTSSIISTTKFSHKKMLGGVVQNIKFDKAMLQNKDNQEALKNLIKVYLIRGGYEIQLNVTDASELIKAKETPQDYRNLMVRVAGYSDYFVALNENLQDEIIKRYAHNIGG